MITNLSIKNFRSIKSQDLDLKKLNILYGPNGSGKSSVMYAPYVMRNFFVNPNQKLNSLFNLGFINLGTYENVSREKDDIFSGIEIGLTSYLFNSNIPKAVVNANSDDFIKYTLELSNTLSPSLEFEIAEFKNKISFDIPFTLSEKKEVDLGGVKFLWNGLTFESMQTFKTGDRFRVHRLNGIYEDIKAMEIISVRRGFFSPIFSTETSNEESVFAMQIRDEALDFELKIDKYFNSIFNKNFRFVAIPGSTSFYLRTHNKSGLSIDLVNEGFGINQTIYMLIKLLKRDTRLAFIEEPEIHIHPSAQNKLIDAFVDIIKNENKQIFLSTHSENIVSSVLTKIASGELSTNDVQFFLAESKDGETIITPQTVNDKGQIEGGLLSFMETELANLKTILGV